VVFFQKLYARLLSMQQDDAAESVPLRDMQRCMARVLRITDAKRTFDARRYDTRGDGTAGWWEFCVAWKEENIRVRYTLAERVFLTLEDPQASRLGRICSVIVLLAILLSAGSFIISTLPELQTWPCPSCEPEAHEAFEWIDTVCVILFTVEYALRLLTASAMRMQLINQEEFVELACAEELFPATSWPQRAWQFVRAWPSLIDLSAILPTYAAWAFPKRRANPAGSTSAGESSTLVLLKLTRFMRVVRAFRLGRRFEAVVIIAKAMKRSLHILWVLVLNLGLNMVVFGAIMYLVEQGDYNASTGEHLRPTSWVISNSTGRYIREMAPSPFESIPHSFWWSLVTATTVGYGDMYPTTDLGKVTAGVAAVWSLCVMALPVGVIGANFQRVWEEYDQEKRTERELLRCAEKMERQAEGMVDPLSHSRRLLFEVYHDSGMHTPVNDIFLGETEIQLQLQPGSMEPVSRRLRLPLRENRTKARRKVTGEVYVHYTWRPGAVSQDGVALEGALSVTICSARNLVAVDWKGSGLSDPYVLLTLYPNGPDHDTAGITPQTAQTKTIFDNPAPAWNETLEFVFSWHEDGVQALREFERRQSISSAPRLSVGSMDSINLQQVLAQTAAAQAQAAQQMRSESEEQRREQSRHMGEAVSRLRGEVKGLREALPQMRVDVQRLRDTAKEMLMLLGQQSTPVVAAPVTICAGTFTMPGFVPEDPPPTQSNLTSPR